MVNEDPNAGLEESMKLAQQLQEEDDKLQKEIDDLHAEPEGGHPPA